MKSLQETYAPKSICYGCGPANPDGFHIQSFVNGDQVIATWTPAPHHHAFPNVLNGGVIGTLLDCHCNWAASWYLMQADHLDTPPCTVTAEYHIQLLRPTPMGMPLTVIATLNSIESRRATISGQLIADDQICATCTAQFVAVSPSHPAHHRW